MSMLTYRLERPLRSPDKTTSRRTLFSQGHTALLERICLRALAILSMGSVLTLLIALKTAAFLALSA